MEVRHVAVDANGQNSSPKPSDTPTSRVRESNAHREMERAADINSVPLRLYLRHAAHVLPASGSLQRDDGTASPSQSLLLLLNGRLFSSSSSSGSSRQSEAVRENSMEGLTYGSPSLTTRIDQRKPGAADQRGPFTSCFLLAGKR